MLIFAKEINVNQFLITFEFNYLFGFNEAQNYV